MIVDVPVDPRGTADVYIDDTIGLCVDIEGSDNAKRLENAILLAIHVAPRPVHKSEPIARDKMAALAKLLAEAGLDETKTILGWLFNFRKMTVALPTNKYVAWKRDVQRMIKSRVSCASELDTMIGRLGNMGVIIPHIYHFLSRLRLLHKRSKNQRSIKIEDRCINDLKLMLYFLEKAKEGIDLNMLAYRRPNRIYRSDACPAGMGGYSDEGHTWRFYIPIELQDRASNNF